MFNRAKRRHRKFNLFAKSWHKLKVIIISFFGIIFMISFIVALDDDASASEGSYHKQSYKERVKRPEIPTTNPDGTVNGLNLLLIDKIKTEGYVKEYLSIARMMETGKLGKLNTNPDVKRTLGVAATEQGAYGSNPALLGSVLPLKGQDPLWDKSKGMTLSTAHKDILDKYGMDRNYGVKSNATGSYFGGWQVNHKYIPNLSKSDLNKKSSFDEYFFPDQMYAFAQVRDWKYTSFDSIFDKNTAEKEAREMGVSIAYSGSPIGEYVPGNTPAEKSANLNIVYNWAKEEIIDKHMDLMDYPALSTGSAAKFLAIFCTVNAGGKISSETYNYCIGGGYQKNLLAQMLGIMGINKSVENFVGEAVDNSLPYQGNYSGIMKKNISGKDFMLVPESLGHYIGEEMLGPIYYARMLQYAGVAGVDPSNPTTYMNKVESGNPGTWVPGGNADLMTKYNISPQTVGKERAGIIDYGFSCLGMLYDFGGAMNYIGTKPQYLDWDKSSSRPGALKFSKPEEVPINVNSHLTGWADVEGFGFDCSGFTQYAYKYGANLEAGRNTYAQMGVFNTIPFSEVKTGDLWFPADTHVALVIRKNANGTFDYVHSPRDYISPGVRDYIRIVENAPPVGWFMRHPNMPN